MDSTDPVLRAQNLVINTPPMQVDLDVYAGDRIALLGDALSLTALLRTLARLDEPADGQLWWAEHNVTRIKTRSLAKLAGSVAFIPANPYTLFEYHSPVDRLFSKAERQRFPLTDLAAAVGLSPVILQQHIKSLSGMTLVRIALMRVILTKPAILLVDDLFSHLAPGIWDDLTGMLYKVLGQEQALLVATQEASIADKLQHKAILSDGRFIVSAQA